MWWVGGIGAWHHDRGLLSCTEADANERSPLVKGPGRITSTSTKRNSFRHFRVKGRERPTDFNYVSKRRVPNGPDPIHNRKAGKSGQPPGRA
ncbi:CLAVATA3/ESR (CLE)-related protein 25 [Acorus gramineus]|uniref:CLAVATA3/ESR (CLE)-related protein 25 n=1 Tax=Acorus gramineus TaxID=55184 RepID=A0AAV9A5X1_ACOGR|nr:CLAVATA3/ESR (CLE)-related protein 25 [Acorus gramineus]